MKKAFKRKSWESDSDTEIDSYANRGNKLKKRARFAHRGQLVPSEGPSAYRETVDYAGVRRSIIHRNPGLFDEDGYEVDSDDDEERIEEALASTAELNPYSSIRIEQLLAPLTASTDLPTHPTLSRPFTSHNLTDLALQSSQMMRRENKSLWQVRHLWTSLCGDQVWVPCETMLGPNDVELYTDDHVAKHLLALSKGHATTNDNPAMINGDGKGEKIGAGKVNNQELGDVEMGGTDPTPYQDHNSRDDKGTHAQGSRVASKPPTEGVSTNSGRGATSTELANGTEDKTGSLEGSAPEYLDTTQKSGEGPLPDPQLQPHVAPPSVISDSLDQQFVHPMFLPPEHSRSDRDLGLPEQEAEDIRRLLALYVQKQEEVCRGVTRLHDGLNRAQRLRQDVLRWSKAEAHSGVNRDMSDGEDWYDRDEWGLAEDLKKGQDDEEEDTTTTGKKTRARR